MICFGINTSWPLAYYSYLLSNTSKTNNSEKVIFWYSAAPLVGNILGALLAANLVDQWGRKWSILAMAPLVSISFVTMGLVKPICLVTLARFIAGVAEGVICTVLPIYIGEIADPTIRTFLTSAQLTFFIMGTLLINFIGSVIDISTFSLITAVIPVIHFLIFITMPESPYWLIKTRNFEKAKKSLQTLKGIQTVNKPMENLQEAITKQGQIVQNPTYSDLFGISSTRKACYIFLIIAATNKISEVALTMYLMTLFQETSNMNLANISPFMYNTLELAAVAVTTFFFADRFSKRFLLITSVSGCGISLSFLAIYFYLVDNHFAIIASNNFHWFPIFIPLFYNISFSIGLGFAPVTYSSELFPMEIKGIALCLAEVITVLFEILFGMIFNELHEQTGTLLPFLCFSVGCWTGLIFIVRYVPDTRGKTLEEIQEFLTSKQDVRYFNRRVYCKMC